MRLQIDNIRRIAVVRATGTGVPAATESVAWCERHSVEAYVRLLQN